MLTEWAHFDVQALEQERTDFARNKQTRKLEEASALATANKRFKGGGGTGRGIPGGTGRAGVGGGQVMGGRLQQQLGGRLGQRNAVVVNQTVPRQGQALCMDHVAGQVGLTPCNRAIGQCKFKHSDISSVDRATILSEARGIYRHNNKLQPFLNAVGVVGGPWKFLNE
jgi:hypothetical protein